jgi:hypothetical protein
MRNGNKYGAKKVQQDGYVFDSLAEAARYRELCLLVRAGRISNLKVHPRFTLQRAFEDRAGHKHRAIYYEADFGYLENGVETIEDVKGVETPAFKLKMKLFLFQYQHYDFRLVKV